MIRTSMILLWLAVSLNGAKPMRIFFIDVEGGQATLIVAPSGESLLVDAGWEERDATRIVEAAKRAGVHQIDHFVLTHYHRDHAGGVAALARTVPIKEFIDHGPNTETFEGSEAIVKLYEAARAGKPHRVARPAGRIFLGGVTADILSSDGRGVEARPGPKNSACSGELPKPPELTENAHSVAMVVQYGRFRFLDLGDILWNQELELVCPRDLIGRVSVVLVTHHGKDTSFPETLMQTIQSRAAILNNAPAKGGSLSTIRIIRRAKEKPDLWQLHRSNEAAAENSEEKFIANPGTDEGHGFTLEAFTDGRFSIVNDRNGRRSTYTVRDRAARR